MPNLQQENGFYVIMSGLSVTDGYMAFADKVYTKYKDKYQEMKDDYLEQGRNMF